MKISLEKKEKFRKIESADKRIVHFLFDSGVKSKESYFAKKYRHFLEGDLDDFEKEFLVFLTTPILHSIQARQY